MKGNHTKISCPETAYLNTVESTDRNMWEIKIKIEDKCVPFKVDTGAEVNVLSDSTWKSLKLSSLLKKTGTSLSCPDHSSLKVMGEAILSLSYQRKSSTKHVFAVNNLKNNLLGLPVIRALQLLSNVCSVDKSIISQYSSLFTGLGKFGQEYTIKLKPNSQPFALSIYSKKYSPSHEDNSTNRITANAGLKHHFTCGRTYTVVCGNGHCSQRLWNSTNLH